MSLSNTPMKQYLYTQHFHRDGKYTLADEADRVVKAEMRCHAFGNTLNMASTLLGGEDVNRVASHVWQRLKDEGMYGRRGRTGPFRWKDLPINPSSEGLIYTPLTKILNAITNACSKDARFKIIWRDEHLKRPASEHAADMKPDIIASFSYASGSDRSPVWWRSMQTLIEVKKQGHALPAAAQLLRYLRQTLREQPDRRFMVGFVYSNCHLTLWHVDRSGALASAPFNVHEHPIEFIRAIVGLVVKSPEELGWDPTMQMYAKRDGERLGHGIYSYNIDANTTPIVTNSPYGRMWLVTVHKYQEDASGRMETEQFVLFRALSLSRAEVLRGRATRVWKAWRLEDMWMLKEDRPVYVFKDSWRDERRGQEGTLYHEAGSCAGVAKLHSFGIVRIGEQEDTTLEVARKGLQHNGKALNLETKQSKVFDAHEEDKYLMPSFKPEEHAEDFFEYDGKTTGPIPRNRIHTRLVMSSYGWPLVHFASLSELVGALYDAVAGHKTLYDKGILHRDISSGNIILPGHPKPNRGLLIDLDYGIPYETHKTLSDDERSGTVAFMSYEMLADTQYRPIRPSRNDVKRQMMAVNAEPSTAAASGVKHDAIHDLESLFWVLCWICLTREGPGKIRETWPKSTEQVNLIRATIAETFEHNSSKDIARFKLELLGTLGTWSNKIMGAASPYFMPLSDCLYDLHELLWDTYGTRDFSRIHEEFLAILAQAEASEEVQNWHQLHPEYQIMEDQERARRNTELKLFESPQAERVTGAGVLVTVASRPATIMEEDESDEDAVLPVVKEDSLPLAPKGREMARRKSMGQMDGQDTSPSTLPRRESARIAKRKSMGQIGEQKAGPSTAKQSASTRITKRKSEGLRDEAEVNAEAGSSSGPARKRKASTSTAENKTKKLKRKHSS
ncbi:hypothetical protein EVG20_g2910 [Dentipellis fragilis]|uniref:Fungal-type protein kinase domain-containing protein n=1 Tax=Dentipellis fragilis TaxID=205917 RepID=A0A4Y9Z5M6_9AGAM|nr:hypothetical protein EVG20_g2910 [Dentipellis fragilis]